jgi:hypothetical protein
MRLSVSRVGLPQVFKKGIGGEDMHRWGKIVLIAGLSLAVAGCPKGQTGG